MKPRISSFLARTTIGVPACGPAPAMRINLTVSTRAVGQLRVVSGHSQRELSGVTWRPEAIETLIEGGSGPGSASINLADGAAALLRGPPGPQRGARLTLARVLPPRLR
jgi:hypothetical protein